MIANKFQNGDFTYMDDFKNKIDKIQKDIKRLRDEAKLKAHLGKAEAQAELGKLENELDDFLRKCKPFTDEAEKTLENTGTALGLAVDELKEGFERVRKLF
jgi:predicted  nucleic acid-binding Zn-ribbon protein